VPDNFKDVDNIAAAALSAAPVALDILFENLQTIPAYKNTDKADLISGHSLQDVDPVLCTGTTGHRRFTNHDFFTG
jgi:hypothetical protein